MAEPNVPVKTIETGYELSDLSPKNIAIFAASLAVTIIVVLWICYQLFQHYSAVSRKTEVPPSPLSYTREPTPEPHLLVVPGQELKAMRAAEDSVLNSYAWVDREKGIVRIPIQRAIDILAQRGLPSRPQSNENQRAAQNQSRNGIGESRNAGPRSRDGKDAQAASTNR
jgi:hypothetical protein